MSVITNRGLAGRIISASQNYSILQPITHRNTSIAARLEEANVNGILVWVQGNTFLLKNIAKTQQVQAGDNVLTSQYSTLYPADLYIGRVIDVRDEPNTLFRRITVAPFVEFAALSSVLIDLRQRNAELTQLEQSIREQSGE
jgi:rod shape-determining protein MreC